MSPPIFVQMGDNIVEAPPPPYFQIYEGQDPNCRSTSHLASDSHVFSDKSIRIGFMRKVFGILSIQVFVTFLLVGILAFVPAVNEYLIQAKGEGSGDVVSYVAGTFLLLDFVCILLIGMQPKWITKTPTNYIFLGFVTICTAVSLAIVTAFIQSKLAVFYITGMTLSVVLVSALFTLQSNHELTISIGILLSVGGVGISGVVMYFSVPLEPEEQGSAISFLLVAGILTIVFGMLWIYMLGKMMMASSAGGKLSKSPDEFILAAMYLYLGTVLIFLLLLAILVGGARFRFCCWWYSTPIANNNSQTDA